MRIVNRQEFLALPEGTVFQKYMPCCVSDIQIKYHTSGRDFYACVVGGDFIEADGTEHLYDVYARAEKTGCEIHIDFDCGGRDGEFDQDQLFAVWSDEDVKGLIERLQGCLSK